MDTKGFTTKADGYPCHGFGASQTYGAGLRQLMEFQPSHLDNWISNGIAFPVTVHYIIKILYKDVMACDLMELARMMISFITMAISFITTA